MTLVQLNTAASAVYLVYRLHVDLVLRFAEVDAVDEFRAFAIALLLWFSGCPNLTLHCRSFFAECQSLRESQHDLNQFACDGLTAGVAGSMGCSCWIWALCMADFDMMKAAFLISLTCGFPISNLSNAGVVTMI